MKAKFMVLLAALVLHVLPAAAGTTADSPVFGQWTLDTATLPMPKEMRPKSVTLSFSKVAGDKIQTQVEIIDQQGKKMDSLSTLPLDGTPGRATGTYWVDVINAKMPESNVLVMQFVYEGIPRSTRVYSVSADGKVLTETETYFKDDATPVMRTAHFTRVAGKP